MEQYKYAEQKIPTDTNKMILQVTNLLKKYDEDAEKGIISKLQPYTDKLIIKIDEKGTTIEIPNDIQQEAIKKWKIIKEDLVYEKKKKEIEDNIIKLSNSLSDEYLQSTNKNKNINRNRSKPKNSKKKNNKKDNSGISYIKIFLIIIIIIGIIIGYAKYKSYL